MESLLLSGATAGPQEVPLIDDMFRLRHAVFSERLKWTSLTPDGRERDIYDRLNPVYLICRDPGGEVIGCWRLLPTVGPYMLKDIFAHLLHGAPAPEAEDVWEISRFAIDPSLRDYVSLGAVGTVVGQMLLELFTFAENYGIRQVVAASDIRFDRILRRRRAAHTALRAGRGDGELPRGRRLGGHQSREPLAHRGPPGPVARSGRRRWPPSPAHEHTDRGTKPWIG